MNKPIPIRRMSKEAAKKSIRKANPERQYGNLDNDCAVDRFNIECSKIIDLCAEYIESEMKTAPKTGRGCRVQSKHVQLCCHKLKDVIDNFMKEEKKGDEE
tara:strand:- start:1967 stop:2269 length:303 start_codon:yes stop_codon:yes gene_type:complete